MKRILRQSNIVVEVKVLNPEKVLNILWSKNVAILNTKRIDIATIKIEIKYSDYKVLKKVVNRCDGKVKIIGSSGILFFVGRLRKSISLVVGLGLFAFIIMCLSGFIWRIEINTINNVAPYEIRQQLYDIGIKPGIRKKNVDVSDIEKEIENVNADVLWIRARMEGGTLKIRIEEKVNPPNIVEDEYGNLVAKLEGEVTNIYTHSGRAVVSEGDVVKVGDIVIEGIEGKEDEYYQVKPKGVVMANTFYEKKMKVQVRGTTIKRTGRIDSDIYLQIFGKKIYLKKAIKDFVEYDKIEESGNVLNKVIYYEKGEVEVGITEDEAIQQAVEELEKSLLNTLTREAKIVDRMVNTNRDGNDNLIIDVVFVVEQNIVDNNPIEY